MFDKVLSWVRQSGRRQGVVAVLDQPLTASQIATRVGLSLKHASFVLGEVLAGQVVQCLNSQASSSRVFWSTELGHRVQNEIRQGFDLPAVSVQFPLVDWYLYGMVCFSHRAAVLRTMGRPMRATEIRRRGKLANPEQRMNSSNVRDVLGVFRRHQLVVPLQKRRRGHPSWVPSEVGKSIQKLLTGALPTDHRYRVLREGRWHDGG